MYTGTVLSNTTDNLVRVWNTDGPGSVSELLDEANPELVKWLLMAHIGAKAQAVS